MFPMTTSTMYNAFKPTRMPLVTANVPNALHRGDSYCLARRVPETMQVKTFLRRHFHRTHRLSRRVDATAAASRPSDVFSSHAKTAWICCALLTWSRCRPAVLTADRIFVTLCYLGRAESRSRSDHSQYIVLSVTAYGHE